MTLPEDPETTWMLVEGDVGSVFAEAFPGELVDVEPFERGERIASEATIVVPWRWVGRHEQPFVGIAATALPVEITGVTMLRDDPDGQLLFHRIVDWLGLYTQLGVVIGTRNTIDRTRQLEDAGAPTTETS